MRLRTQFRITIYLFSAFLLVLAVSAIITNLQVRKASAQERIAASIAQGANTLSYLANDYLIYRETQQLKRWQSSFASFSVQVASLHAEKSDQQALIANMQVNQNRLKEVFDSVASAPQKSTSDPSFLQVSWSRMAIMGQGLVSDASRLSQLLRQRIERLINMRAILIYFTVCLFGVLLLASYMLTYHRVHRSLATLQGGAAVIGSGNLDFIIKEIRNDEIGDLSHDFNRMTSDLKTVTASKTDLEKEVAERQRAEEALQKAHEQLELRVEQRTAELQKMYEEQNTYLAMLEQSNRDLEEFAHVASHDLQEPLRKIQTFADRLANMDPGTLREQERDYLDRMQRAAGRMQALVLDLLRYSSITSKPEAFTRFNLRKPVEEAVTDVAVLCRELQADIELGDLPEISANRVQMRQLFQNLISNGLQYHGENKPVVKIYCLSTADGPFWEIHVEDNGIGFDERYLDKIFKPFQRLHGKDSPYQGTGIGLAICRRIAERHGGSITARSQPGEGATFIVKLPRTN